MTRKFGMSTSAGLVAAGMLALAPAAHAVDFGISGVKLIIIDKTVAANKAKVVYVSKKDPGIQKGPGAVDFKNGPQQISGTFDAFYTDTPGNVATFALPAEWLVNKDDKVAKFVNKEAPGGPSEAKVAVVKPEKVAKVVTKGLGGIDLFVGAPSDSGGMTTVFTIFNDVDNSTIRMCTKFAVGEGSNVNFKEIAAGTGRKLVAKGGVPTACPPTGSPTGALLNFTTGPAVGDCGETRSGGSGGSVIATLGCGTLNIGGGASTVPPGATPDGALTRFLTDCSSLPTCTVSATPFDGTNTCSDTGCPFGPPLPIVNGGLSTCVLNTFSSPAGGFIDTVFGSFSGALPLSSAVTVTGNATAPCPLCVSGFCDTVAANPGDPCVAINTSANSYECLPAGSALAPFPVNLAPISTGTETHLGSTPCPLQTSAGCFGDVTCDYIEVRGSDAGELTPGPKDVTLAAAFCIPSTGDLLIDGAADLPGPGAVTLPGSLELLP